MKKKIKKFISALIPSSIKTEIHNEFLKDARVCYSQEGEDIVLERFFENKPKGFFVDIGAHHPTRFSNTYRFYLKGWRGINIDATPGSMTPFKTLRPEDINLEMGVTPNEGELTYYLFHEPALNTFSKERADYIQKETGYTLKSTVKVKTKSLGQILEENVPKNTEIDFLTIDVEGLDIEVLKSNNWEKFKPTMILAEDLGGGIEDLTQSKMYSFLKTLGYTLVARTYNTMFFKQTKNNK